VRAAGDAARGKGQAHPRMRLGQRADLRGATVWVAAVVGSAVMAAMGGLLLVRQERMVRACLVSWSTMGKVVMLRG
jgi:hypothetical protein